MADSILRCLEIEPLLAAIALEGPEAGEQFAVANPMDGPDGIWMAPICLMPTSFWKAIKQPLGGKSS